ncbi:MAG: cell division protein FtsZ, partial [Sphingomonas bacterium]|nr:cell division protein FtsZ [Sphingomonas bacterium]
SGIEELQQHVDTLIVIPNQNLFRLANSDTTFKEAFEMADEVLQQGVRGITDLMVMPGLINLDFADVRSVMGEMGKAMMGTGEASGENRAIEAAEKAISNPLLDGVSLKGAKGVIISITGGDDMKLMEVDEAASHIKELVDPDANIIWGSAFNNGLEGKIRVSVVATGIESETGTMAQPAKVFSFPGRTGTPVAVTPVTPTPTINQIATTSNDDDMLELTQDDEAGELVLDGDDILTQPVGSVPVGPPADEEPLTEEAGNPATDEYKPKIAPGGGTLFERMSNIARGAAQAEGSDGEPMPSFRRDPLDIPRFLNRQNNQ